MKARLAKKIIKASDFYELYSLECRGKRRKRYPYWFRRWVFCAGWMYASKGTKVKHRRVLYWFKSYDMRLDEAIRRLPKYTQSLLNAIKVKRMERRIARHNRELEQFIQQVFAKQSGKEGNSNGKADFSISSKMESL
ncbi:hypothetical protein [Prevotella sp.]|uniref:hypothetical protein n=1 Tax=Prevotella sp. TaxID=59823 RepID=UPI003AB90DD3